MFVLFFLFILQPYILHCLKNIIKKIAFLYLSAFINLEKKKRERQQVNMLARLQFIEIPSFRLFYLDNGTIVNEISAFMKKVYHEI